MPFVSLYTALHAASQICLYIFYESHRICDPLQKNIKRLFAYFQWTKLKFACTIFRLGPHTSTTVALLYFSVHRMYIYRFCGRQGALFPLLLLSMSSYIYNVVCPIAFVNRKCKPKKRKENRRSKYITKQGHIIHCQWRKGSQKDFLICSFIIICRSFSSIVFYYVLYYTGRSQPLFKFIHKFTFEMICDFFTSACTCLFITIKMRIYRLKNIIHYILYVKEEKNWTCANSWSSVDFITLFWLSILEHTV